MRKLLSPECEYTRTLNLKKDAHLDAYSGGGCDKAPDGTLTLKYDRTLEEVLPRCLKGSLDSNEAVGVAIGKPMPLKCSLQQGSQ